MPRSARARSSTDVYHLTARGNDGAAIFTEDWDRWTFRVLLAETTAAHAWRLLAYCLMDTHYHLLLAVPADAMAQGMRHLNGTYAQRFNRRHRRSGHLFQGRYHSQPVEHEPHLLEAVRYIALNPVRAGLCCRPDGWPWSSYRATIGLDPSPSYLAITGLLAPFGSHPAGAREALRRFVESAASWGESRSGPGL